MASGMRILVTGATGFVGGHLLEKLVGENHHLFGMCRRGRWPAALSHLASQVELLPGELQDLPRIATILEHTRPDWIIHLAGYANPGRSYAEADVCWRDNLHGTRTLYEAVIRTGQRPRILYVSTGLIYGEPDEPGGTCDERTTFKPATPYAASKAAADILSYQYTRYPGLDIVRIRLFNQIGPRQSADYAIANFARQIAAAEAGRQAPVIETGDLSAQRDITDVRDMVAAFPLLLQHGRSGEAYNAGRGQAFRVGDLLNQLIQLARIPLEIRERKEAWRSRDTLVTKANTQKLYQCTGWQPQIPIEQTLRDILNDWRKKMLAAGE
jgi:GDP-4-dehydro-6-deoxy-D-mannose reductase